MSKSISDRLKKLEYPEGSERIKTFYMQIPRFCPHRKEYPVKMILPYCNEIISRTYGGDCLNCPERETGKCAQNDPLKFRELWMRELQSERCETCPDGGRNCGKGKVFTDDEAKEWQRLSGKAELSEAEKEKLSQLQNKFTECKHERDNPENTRGSE